jgi:hypothetical protein
LVSLRILMQHFSSMLIRIQGFFDLMTTNGKILQLENTSFFYKNCKLFTSRLPCGPSKLQEKPSALKTEHPALQNRTLFPFFFHFVGLPADHNQCRSIRIQNTVNNITQTRFLYARDYSISFKRG